MAEMKEMTVSGISANSECSMPDTVRMSSRSTMATGPRVRFFQMAGLISLNTDMQSANSDGMISNHVI